MIRVCSGWHPAGRIQYGERFKTSFDEQWPADVQLQVYVEQPERMPRDACRDLWSIPGARDCAERYDNLANRGRDVQPNWKMSCKANGYNFRFDAHKFFKQILIPQAASLDMTDGDILVWLDGDVVTTKPVPVGLVPKLLNGNDMAFLGREPKHSEIGFWAARINERTKAFLAEIALFYTSGSVLELKEHHSAYVWDAARHAMATLVGLTARNLCPPGARGHVFPTSPVGPYLNHSKGKRKSDGKP